MAEPALTKEVSLGRLATAQAAKSAAEVAAIGPLARVEEHRNWVLLARLPLRLNVGVALPQFRVRDLLALRVGRTVSSAWKVSEDVPLQINGVEFGWGEFEVAEQQRMALRLTRLS
jgi:flagellar motor switch/type III secretory pathway protein FliN